MFSCALLALIKRGRCFCQDRFRQSLNTATHALCFLMSFDIKFINYHYLLTYEAHAYAISLDEKLL